MEEWKKDNKVILSTKDFVFKKRLVKNLTKKYVGPYVIEEVVLKNTVKLKLLVLASMRIHLVVNISKVVKYRELVKRQKVKEPKQVEVDRVKE